MASGTGVSDFATASAAATSEDPAFTPNLRVDVDTVGPASTTTVTTPG